MERRSRITTTASTIPVLVTLMPTIGARISRGSQLEENLGLSSPVKKYRLPLVRKRKRRQSLQVHLPIVRPNILMIVFPTLFQRRIPSSYLGFPPFPRFHFGCRLLNR